jgi:integrase
MLEENNVRTGFFEHEEFLRFREELPEYLKGFATFGYKLGWRFEEIASLTWAQIDRTRWTVRLEVGTTKNKSGRIMFLDSELQEIVRELWQRRKASARMVPFVFTNLRGDGKIRDCRDAWDKAFENSKVPRKLFHDFRRTAVRNMVRAGIPEKVAMKISGHKTRSVFERYNIVDDRDMELAARRQEIYLDSLLGTNLGTMADSETKKGAGRIGLTP